MEAIPVERPAVILIVRSGRSRKRLQKLKYRQDDKTHNTRSKRHGLDRLIDRVTHVDGVAVLVR